MRLALPHLTGTEITRSVNDAFGALKAALLRVPQSQYVDVSAPSSADTAFVVQHSLGRVPVYFTAQSESDARCYATAADKNEWTASLIKIRCTAANAPLRVKVEAE